MQQDFAPGMRVIIRDEEWMIKKVETNTLDNKALHCVGISPLIKDRDAIFLADLEDILIVDPAKLSLKKARVRLSRDSRARYQRE